MRVANSFFLLRILHKASKSGKRAVTSNELIRNILLDQIGKQQGIRVYDLELDRDRQIKSLGLTTDLSTLEAMNLIALEGDDVRITITAKGETLAESIQLPDEMEKLIDKLQL